MFSLEPVPKVITFDCYGTLVQWREVLLDKIGGLIRGRDDVDSATVLDTFSRHSRGLERETPHRLYKDVLRHAFRSALSNHDLLRSDADVEALRLDRDDGAPPGSTGSPAFASHAL